MWFPPKSENHDPNRDNFVIVFFGDSQVGWEKA